MRREERERARAASATPRTLGKADFLLEVRDDTRQGAIRFRQPGTSAYYSAHRHAVPRLIEVARLMHAADRLREDGGFDRDLADLIDAGSYRSPTVSVLVMPVLACGHQRRGKVISVDMDAFMAFVGKFAGDLGAVVAAGNVVLGDRLGLYRALADGGPQTAAELAARTGTDARYVAEWLAGQAAGGYLEYESDGRYSMTPEQALALADPAGPVDVAGAFTLALGAVQAVPAVSEAFRTGAGIGWHEQSADVFTGCERFFRAGYAAHLVQDWLPAFPGVVGRLTAGGSVADVGCGLGASTVLLAQAFPASRCTGSDYHAESIALATKRAADAGVADRVTFETASAATFSGAGYDLVTTFDCLHDMGDPAAAARHVREALAPGGSWLIVEPMAADTIEGNLNPVGRVYYNFSTLLCLPNARSQHGAVDGPGGGAMLGAQAGEAAIRSVVLGAGFSSFRRAAQTPFNLVYEAKP